MVTVNPNFDTQAACDSLVNTGFKRSDASSIVKVIKVSQEHLATTDDLAHLTESLTAAIHRNTYLILCGVFAINVAGLTIFETLLTK